MCTYTVDACSHFNNVIALRADHESDALVGRYGWLEASVAILLGIFAHLNAHLLNCCMTCQRSADCAGLCLNKQQVLHRPSRGHSLSSYVMRSCLARCISTFFLISASSCSCPLSLWTVLLERCELSSLDSDKRDAMGSNEAEEADAPPNQPAPHYRVPSQHIVTHNTRKAHKSASCSCSKHAAESHTGWWCRSTTLTCATSLPTPGL